MRDYHPYSPVQPGGSNRKPILVVILIAGAIVAARYALPWLGQTAERVVESARSERRVQEDAPAQSTSDRDRADPVEAAEPGSPPIPLAPLLSIFSDDDYPDAAIRADEQGLVMVELTVGTDGRVERCVVTRSSQSRILDGTTCRIFVERARFAPARDGQDTPIPGTVRTRVQWRLPDE